jgi:predicted nucleotide-binding protein (sugar kinase/HSP70/actin superfamily)
MFIRHRKKKAKKKHLKKKTKKKKTKKKPATVNIPRVLEFFN